MKIPYRTNWIRENRDDLNRGFYKYQKLYPHDKESDQKSFDNWCYDRFREDQEKALRKAELDEITKREKEINLK